jgi:HEAT repeat protein
MFDRKLWRAQINERMSSFAHNPWQEVQMTGGHTLLGYLVMRTLEPLLEAFEHEPIAVVRTLADMTDGAGANYIVRHARRMRFQSMRMFERDLHAKADFRAAIESLIIALETITLVRQRLNSDRAAWFRNKLQHELLVYNASEFVRLRQILEDPSWRPLHDIIRSLRQRYGHYTPADMILLREALHDSTPRVRAEGARRIGEFVGMPSDQLIGKLLDVALYDCDAEPRNAAACAFGKLRDRMSSREMLEDLADKLLDKDKFTRSATARVIEELGDLACTPKIIENLVTIVVDDDDAYARESAACALGHLGNNAATPEVIRALTQVSQTAEAVAVHDATLTALINLRKGSRATQTVRPSERRRNSDRASDSDTTTLHQEVALPPNPEQEQHESADGKPLESESSDETRTARARHTPLNVPGYLRPGTDTLHPVA